MVTVPYLQTEPQKRRCTWMFWMRSSGASLRDS